MLFSKKVSKNPIRRFEIFNLKTKENKHDNFSCEFTEHKQIIIEYFKSIGFAAKRIDLTTQYSLEKGHPDLLIYDKKEDEFVFVYVKNINDNINLYELKWIIKRHEINILIIWFID